METKNFEIENKYQQILSKKNTEINQNTMEQINNVVFDIIEKYTKTNNAFTPPPSKEVLNYLPLVLFSKSFLNKYYPLKLNVKPVYIEKTKILNFLYTNDVFGDGIDSVKNHIIRLAYENDYFNMFSEEQRLETQKEHDKWDQMDVVVRVEHLNSKYYDEENSKLLMGNTVHFPYASLTENLNLLNISKEDLKTINDTITNVLSNASSEDITDSKVPVKVPVSLAQDITTQNQEVLA